MDTTNIEQPQALDMILEYLVENKGERKSFRQIHKDVFSDQDIDIFLHLADVILNFNDNLVDGRYSESYSIDWRIEGNMMGTAITEHFLKKQGGFTKWYADQAEEKTKEQRERELTQKALIDQISTNRINRIGIIVSIFISINCSYLFSSEFFR